MNRRKKRPKLVKKLRRDAAYLALRLVMGFFRLLPRGAALAVGRFLGGLAARVDARDRRKAEKQLRIAFGNEKSEDEIGRLARESFENMAMNFVDVARLKTMKPEEIERVCVPHDMDRLWKALEAGNGVIGLTSHTGCWELLGVYLAVVGVPIAVIARRLYDPRLEELLVDTRTSGGMRNISRGRDTRDILRLLREGWLVGVLIDQDVKNLRSVFVDFFGRPAWTPVGPAQLSLKFDAPVVPVLTWRDAGHRHHVCIGEPVTIEPTGDAEEDIRALTAKSSKVIEGFIREHPEQWVWLHERWRTAPGEEAKTN